MTTPSAPTPPTRRRWTRAAIALPVAALLLVTGGTWLYVQSQGDAPDRLTVEDAATATTAAPTGEPGTMEGELKVGQGSQAGYRVKEVLFGQSTEAVGRTSAVTGTATIEGSRVTAATFSVDMTTVASDKERRDGQFRGRIMDVAQFPTATFMLTGPIELGLVPAVGGKVSVIAKGSLTLRGTTKDVSWPLEAERTASGVTVAGSLPVVFEEWGIPNPSFGPAQTEDRGEIEVLLVLGR